MNWIRGAGALAQYVGCSRRWIELALAENAGPPGYRIGPRLLVFNKREVDEWIRQHDQGVSA